MFVAAAFGLSSAAKAQGWVELGAGLPSGTAPRFRQSGLVLGQRHQTDAGATWTASSTGIPVINAYIFVYQKCNGVASSGGALQTVLDTAGAEGNRASYALCEGAVSLFA